ncbi:winged helix-turn-helix domain-containing protein [Streptomyces celluloflavus]|uniref:winged helix-turn-helix domain-containing protein n=1 Tax=Streptomyces celluloflavus TaxID=58344 RepID=UPI0036C7D82E
MSKPMERPDIECPEPSGCPAPTGESGDPLTGPFADRTRLTDPRALRAYAHPTRMALVGLLRNEGPLTATRAAALTGESVASCSYHLRMLAKYDLVQQAEGGRGREKPWRATTQFTDWPSHSDDPAVADASAALNIAVAENYYAKMTRALERRHTLPRAWQEAEQFGDVSLYLTADELTELDGRVTELLAPYLSRQSDPASRPADARPVSYLRVAFVRHGGTADAAYPDPGECSSPGLGEAGRPGSQEVFPPESREVGSTGSGESAS